MGNKQLSAADAVLDIEDDDVLEAVRPARGNETHLSKSLDITSLKKITADGEIPEDARVIEIDPAVIKFMPEINHRHQAWLSTDNKHFASLIGSIDQAGQKIPILLRKVDSELQLIYGSRRRQACEHLGINVKAIIVEGISDDEAHELAILENTNHHGLSPLEEAKAVLAYKERNELIDSEVAVVFSRTRSWVTQQNSFASLNPEFIAACTDPWNITERATRPIRSTSNAAQVRRQLKSLKSERLSFKNLIKRINDKPGNREDLLIKNEQGRVVAKLSAAKSIRGRSSKQVVFYEDIDKAALVSVIETIENEFNLE